MAKARQPAASNRTGREQAAKEKFAKIQMDRSNKFRRGVLVCFIKDPQD